ncbi:hypothetical protein B9Z19DRAFT_1165977, partial [Tuber borchii]
MTGAGKSYFIREVSGNSAVEVSSDLYPCTNKVQSYSFEYAGARITLVDTPGFNGMNRSDTKVLRMIGDWASEAYRNSQLLSGIIYLHPITHTRMEGSILKNLRTLQSLCGQEALENVLLTTTQWSRVNWAEGEFRESRLRVREFWGGLIEKGATLQRFAGTRASGLELIHKLMLNKRKPLHIQNQMVKQHMTLLETDAGKCINELLVGQKKKHKEEVESLSLEHQEAMKAKEDEMKEILAAEQAKAQKKLEEAATEGELLVESHAAEIKKRKTEERERREEIGRGEKAVIAVATKDLSNAVLIDTFHGSYCSTRARWILDINNHKEFELNTFAVAIQCQFNPSSGSWGPVKTLVGPTILGPGIEGTGTKRTGSTHYVFYGGARYVLQPGTSIRRGGQEFFIFMK